MVPLVLVASGVIALLAGAVTLRTFGPRYRVGRLLAATRRVGIEEALAIARAGPPRYVRIDGRIDAADEFEDAAHRPLVLRRTRLEAWQGRQWRRFEDSREAVPFEIREGLASIAVDAAALDAGLVVIPLESTGNAADLVERAPGHLPATTPVRALVEQISSVEHAIVLGVPVSSAEAGGLPTMSSGLGRPLVLTTLEPEEAIRILAGGTGRPRFAAACLVLGLALVAAGVVLAGAGALTAFAASVLAASPGAEATPASGGDPRSSGEGPGLVGEPGLALLAVIVIAALAIAGTTIYLRLTSGRQPPEA